MNLNIRSIVSVLCLIAIYIGLSMVGLYHMIGTVLFPIISVPAIICFTINTLNKRQHIVIQMAIIMGIYLTTSHFVCILVYLVSVCVPTYVILYLYQEKFPLPNIIMYATLSLSVVVLLFFIIMRSLGMDFEAYYLSILESIKLVSLDDMQEWLAIKNAGLTPSNIAELSLQMKEVMNSVIDIMQSVYSALIILQLLITTGITVIIVNVFSRCKNKQFPALAELLNFRLSKISVLILFISTLIISLNGDEGAKWSMLSLNVAFFLMTLFQIVGAFALIAIVSRKGISKGIKILGIVTVFILLSISPYLVMFFGCLDTIFNYRKVKIVV